MESEMSFTSQRQPENYYGRTIKTAKIIDDVLKIAFTDSTEIDIWDGGQDCCENRYMTCDDNVGALEGGRLVEIELLRKQTINPDAGDEHEAVFVVIKTDVIAIVLQTHNEHNGYYGGFSMKIKEIVDSN